LLTGLPRSKVGLILIILGLLVIFLPIFGYTQLTYLTYFAGALLGSSLYLLGITSTNSTSTDKFTSKGAGSLITFLSLEIVFLNDLHPPVSILGMDILTLIAVLTVMVAGLFLMYTGTNLAKKAFEVKIFTAKNFMQLWIGRGVIILGLIYLILPWFVRDPLNLGNLIGLCFFAIGNILILE
jgi:hypothetical protein